MIKPIILANAAAIVMAIWVVACALLSYTVPDLLLSVAQSWMHTMNLELIKTTFTPSLGNIVFGIWSITRWIR